MSTQPEAPRRRCDIFTEPLAKIAHELARSDIQWTYPDHECDYTKGFRAGLQHAAFETYPQLHEVEAEAKLATERMANLHRFWTQQ